MRLDPANFALPEVKPEEPWPPASSHPVHPVYVHAARVLRQRDIETNGRSRSRVCSPPHPSPAVYPLLLPPRPAHPTPAPSTRTLDPHPVSTRTLPPPARAPTFPAPIPANRSVGQVALPMLPEMPIALSTQPCQSMLLHPGRLRTAEAEPLVRVSIVSMLVVAQLPSEIVVTAHVTHHPSVPGEEEPPITLRFRREEFTQQGPSGPIESKKTFSLRLPQLGQSAGASLVVRFELQESEAMRTLDFCDTAPLLIEKAPPLEKSSQLNGVAT